VIKPHHHQISSSFHRTGKFSPQMHNPQPSSQSFKAKKRSTKNVSHATQQRKKSPLMLKKKQLASNENTQQETHKRFQIAHLKKATINMSSTAGGVLLHFLQLSSTYKAVAIFSVCVSAVSVTVEGAVEAEDDPAPEVVAALDFSSTPSPLHKGQELRPVVNHCSIVR
jgi:hypothetical protein